MIRGLGWLCVAAAMLAAGHARAESFDTRDLMGGGPNFRGGSYSGSSPIPRGRASSHPGVSSSLDVGRDVGCRRTFVDGAPGRV